MGAVKDKCYADKPETIDDLKDNIRVAISGIQLQTIDNVLKNWTDRLDYCMASRNELNYSPLLTGRIILLNKKKFICLKKKVIWRILYKVALD